MTTQSFLCGNCRREMCDDCREIAEEYQELLQIRTNALQAANYQVEQLRIELENEKRRSAMYEEVAKAGMGPIIGAWIDKEIGQILKSQKVTA